MPTWIVHGFRWPRRAINIHVILQNLEDCAPGWIMAPDTAAELHANFSTLYPEQLKHLPDLRFIEQYDPDDETAADQPYAYICDQVHEIRLGVDLDDFKSSKLPCDTMNALVGLRNEVAPGEKIGWYVVVNGDVERWAPPVEDEEAEESDSSLHGAESNTPTPTNTRGFDAKLQEDDGEEKVTGFKKWLGKVKKVRSLRDLRSDLAVRPLPNEDQPPASPLRSLALHNEDTNATASNGKATK